MAAMWPPASAPSVVGPIDLPPEPSPKLPWLAGHNSTST